MKPRSVGLCAAMAGCLAQVAGADDWWAWKRYTAALETRCPAKRLNLIPYGELPDVIDDFSKRLSKRERKLVSAAVTDRCKHVQMGASCGNEAFLRVMIKRNRVGEFAAFVCALPERCTAQSECRQDP